MPDEKTGRLDEEYVVQMKGITKVYPNGVAANQGVDFNLRRGEIHALMGENGAGKSTLMKMLFGLEQPTSGEIWVHGEKLTLSSPTVAISHGIGMVHQHFMLVPSLTVAENMVLGMAPRKGLFIDHAKAVAITKEYAEKYASTRLTITKLKYEEIINRMTSRKSPFTSCPARVSRTSLTTP